MNEVLLSSSGQPQAHYVAQDSLELTILSPGIAAGVTMSIRLYCLN